MVEGSQERHVVETEAVHGLFHDSITQGGVARRVESHDDVPTAALHASFNTYPPDDSSLLPAAAAGAGAGAGVEVSPGVAQSGSP